MCNKRCAIIDVVYTIGAGDTLETAITSIGFNLWSQGVHIQVCEPLVKVHQIRLEIENSSTSSAAPAQQHQLSIRYLISVSSSTLDACTAADCVVNPLEWDEFSNKSPEVSPECLVCVRIMRKMNRLNKGNKCKWAAGKSRPSTPGEAMIYLYR
jgi:hypothetical protein